MCQNNIFVLFYLCDLVKTQADMICFDLISRKPLSILKDDITLH